MFVSAVQQIAKSTVGITGPSVGKESTATAAHNQSVISKPNVVISGNTAPAIPDLQTFLQSLPKPTTTSLLVSETVASHSQATSNSTQPSCNESVQASANVTQSPCNQEQYNKMLLLVKQMNANLQMQSGLAAGVVSQPDVHSIASSDAKPSVSTVTETTEAVAAVTSVSKMPAVIVSQSAPAIEKVKVEQAS